MGYKYYEINKLNKLHAKAKNISSKKPLFPGCKRIIYTDATTLPFTHHDKVIEEVDFNNSKNNGKYALAIGLNPVLANPNRFDQTNRNISIALKDRNYKGYYLVNLYTYLAPSAEDLLKVSNLNHHNNKSFVKYFLNKGYDIFIFWGPKAKKYSLIDKKISNIIKSQIKTKSKKLFFCAHRKSDKYDFEHAWKFAPKPKKREIDIKFMDFVNFDKLSNKNDLFEPPH